MVQDQCLVDLIPDVYYRSSIVLQPIGTRICPNFESACLLLLFQLKIIEKTLMLRISKTYVCYLSVNIFGC